MGRPPTREKKLKDGFYIEVRNKGSQSGVKIWRGTREQMVQSAEDYSRAKDVVQLGEMKDGKWLDKKGERKKRKKKA